MRPLLIITRYWWQWILLVTLALTVLLVPVPAVAAVPASRTFHIEARRFAYSPAILKVNPGDRVTIDLVAWVWQSYSTPEQILAGGELFKANCAACHGENGAGDGVYASQLAAGTNPTSSNQPMGEHTQQPVDFSDPSQMLSASPAHLQGKIIRGGMGTGMPSWGAIFTEDQTWVLVAYLWSFQFQLEKNP